MKRFFRKVFDSYFLSTLVNATKVSVDLTEVKKTTSLVLDLYTKETVGRLVIIDMLPKNWTGQKGGRCPATTFMRR
jgi:hypothetical protein